MANFNSREIIRKMVNFSPRQLEGEDMARKLIIDTLEEARIPFILQKFQVGIPEYKKYYLKADGKSVKCLPTALKSGEVTGKDNMISSLIFSLDSSETPNINFNPHCKVISLPTFYFSPSFSVAPKDLGKIFNAKNVRGFVDIGKINHTSYNILVGNNRTPKNIYFAHYDGLGKGALDNASGVAACLDALLKDPSSKKDNLIVFSGAEELSFDNPNYWGYGFRVFEKKYKNLLIKSKNIIIVDCVGSDKPALITDPEVLFLGFPIVNFKKLSNKILMLSSCTDFNKLMKVYHSDMDDINGINKKYFDMAVKKLLEIFHGKFINKLSR